MDCTSNKDILNFAIENGIIDINAIQKQIEMNERLKYLEMHTYKKWKGSDGNWHTYLPDAEKGRIPKKRATEEDIDKVIIDFWKEQSEDPTIDDVFSEWNNRRLELNKISPSTHLRNKQYYDRHYKDFGNKKIKHIDSDDIIDFLEEQIPKYNLSAKSFCNLKSITKGMFKRAKKRKLIKWSIEEAFYDLDVSDVDFKKTIKEDYEEVFDENETEKIINYLKSNIDSKNIAILLMFVTGIRIGELVALKHEVFEDTFFRIRRTETRYVDEDGKYIYDIKEHPKSDAGVRDVIVPEGYVWILKQIKCLNPFGEFVFVNSLGERITTNCIRRRLERICKKLDIYHKSPHKIRKTYGTILLDNNVDQRLIVGQMGHSSINVTEKHYHRNRKSLDKKNQILSSIPDFNCKADNF